MKIISSYAVKLLDRQKDLKNTANVYRAAVSYLIDVIDKEWDAIGPVYKGFPKEGKTVVEKFTHMTEDNPNPKYDFDKQFCKFPSYFRRAAIAAALGAVSSYRSNYANWEEAGKKGNPPKLGIDRDEMPVFYHKEMSRCNGIFKDGSDTIELKLYVNKDWVWVKVPCRRQDVKYLAKHLSAVKPMAPVLELKRKHRRHTTYCLRFAFKEHRDLKLRDEPLEKRTILAVDLGINTDAVCTVMASNGTVIARKFINFPVEKDQLGHLLNKIKRLQREHGRTGGRHEWQKAMRVSDELAKKIAGAITDVACLYAVNVVVFEYLDMQGKVRGSKKQRLHLWRKRGIQKMVEQKAHRNLIRISRVCAWGTSKLAFDGSGEIIRGRQGLTGEELQEILTARAKKAKLEDGRPETYVSHSLCTFTNGKQYNCDLSASYNIGARYFLREYCKDIKGLEEQLPPASKRVYADLLNLMVPAVAA